MKQTRSIINNVIAGVIGLTMISTLAAQNVREGTATVVRIKGPARYTVGNNVWQPLKVGVVLKAGTIVQTSTQKGSFVDLVLGGGGGTASVAQPAVLKPSAPSSMASSMAYQPSAEQNVVRIWENSALGIDKLTTQQTGMEEVTDTQLDLKTGRISGSVKKMSAASKYEVKLPNGVAGIRGTMYDIFAEGIVKVRVGSVVLAWVDPKTSNVVTQVVSGGQSYDARTGTLAPLSPSDTSAMDSLSTAIRVVGAAPPAILTTDRSIQNISPVGAVPPVPGTPPPGG